MQKEKWIFCAAMALLPFGFYACAKAEKPVATKNVYHLAGGCYAVSLDNGLFLSEADKSYRFAAEEKATAFRLQASDLGHYVLYDQNRHYVAAVKRADDWPLRRTNLKADIRIPYHQQFSDAEWAIESPHGKSGRYLLRHLNSHLYLGQGRLVPSKDAESLQFIAREDCSEYPELPLEAKGTVRSKPWPNGDVYGVADSHSHLMTNLGFGGGGIFHGAPFHRLGVEHALDDCEEDHGVDGKRDIIGFFLGGSEDLDIAQMAKIFVDGSVPGFNHATGGYPKFASWPDARNSKTHQTQYYRWLQRAYMGGLRLIFQHATGNSALCELLVGLGSQEAPYTCNDMASVDHTLDEVHAMERYIDAQSGGPGLGWFRIVTTPEEARTEINKGNLAVVLGIEISNVFDCFLTPPAGMPECTVEHVKASVRRYYEKGVRVVFPVHKYDNGFSAGDGHRGVIEIGNVMNSGHYSNYTLDCPDLKHNFDNGDVVFGGLNRPRENYFSTAPLDMYGLSKEPMLTMLPLVADLTEPKLEGSYCQAAGLTELGGVLIRELIAHGMLIDLAHLPKWSTVQALAILEENHYPAISTHGQTYDGLVYRNGGTSDGNLGGCGDPGHPGSMGEQFLSRAREVRAANGLPAQPLGFDLNGFAGSRAPRFGPDSGCSAPQANPVTYPFKAYDGKVVLEQPTLGERVVDFNEEGMLHIGLLPELIEDVRRDGTSDAELEPLFRTAETLIRVWETAEAAAK